MRTLVGLSHWSYLPFHLLSYSFSTWTLLETDQLIFFSLEKCVPIYFTRVECHATPPQCQCRGPSRVHSKLQESKSEEIVLSSVQLFMTLIMFHCLRLSPSSCLSKYVHFVLHRDGTLLYGSLSLVLYVLLSKNIYSLVN